MIDRAIALVGFASTVVLSPVYAQYNPYNRQQDTVRQQQQINQQNQVRQQQQQPYRPPSSSTSTYSPPSSSSSYSPPSSSSSYSPPTSSNYQRPKQSVPTQPYREPIRETPQQRLDRAKKLPAVNVDSSGLALGGRDAVAYFTGRMSIMGNPAYTAQHEGATYRFANAAHRDAFLAAPAKYLPQYGGYSAPSMLSGAKVDPHPDQYAIMDGKLYLFNDASTPWSWSDAERADKNWREIHPPKPSLASTSPRSPSPAASAGTPARSQGTTLSAANNDGTIGRQYYYNAEYTKAIPHLEAWVRVNPKDVRAFSFLGHAYLLTGNPRAAAPHLRQAADLEPKNAHHRLALARALAGAGQKDAARIAADESVALALGNPFFQQERDKLVAQLQTPGK